LNPTTGNNQISDNTMGDSNLTTGDTNVNVNVLNVANTNISGGDMWLVLVNQAGNWVGKILGAPTGSSNMAGSAGTEFSVDQNGQINVTNSGNAAGSANTGSVNSETNNTLVQSNNAKVVNNLNLSANTGGNIARDNTMSNSSITTGDANIVANVVNFVNNNISGGGKLYVMVVNVFGSWAGDFVTPGTTKPADSPQGGTQSSSSNDSNSNSNNSSNNNSNNSASGSVSSNSSSGITTLITHTLSYHNSNPGSWFSGQSGSNGPSDPTLADANSQGLVAGVNTIAGPTTKGWTLNLAWLVVALPIIFGLGFITRRFLGKRLHLIRPNTI